MQAYFVRWSHTLNMRYRHSGFHYKKDQSGAVPQMAIPKFGGYGGVTNVYEFLNTFKLAYLNKVFNPVDKALLLFNNFLSETLQREFKEYERNYQKLTYGLILSYGEGAQIVENQMTQIQAIKAKSSSTQHTVEYLKELLARFRILRNMYKMTGADCSDTCAATQFENISKPAIRKLYDRETITKFVGWIVLNCKNLSYDFRKAWLKLVSNIQTKTRQRTQDIIEQRIAADDTSEVDGRQLYDDFITLIEEHIDLVRVTGEYMDANPRVQQKKEVKDTKSDVKVLQPGGKGKPYKLSKSVRDKLIAGQLNPKMEGNILRRLFSGSKNLAYRLYSEAFTSAADHSDGEMN